MNRNVDRYVAIWQAIFPDTYMQQCLAESETWTIKFNDSLDANSRQYSYTRTTRQSADRLSLQLSLHFIRILKVISGQQTASAISVILATHTQNLQVNLLMPVLSLQSKHSTADQTMDPPPK